MRNLLAFWFLLTCISIASALPLVVLLAGCGQQKVADSETSPAANAEPQGQRQQQDAAGFGDGDKPEQKQGQNEAAGVAREKAGEAEAKDAEKPVPEVRLGKVPAVKLAPRPAITPNRATRIKLLIASLAKIDSPDFGLSATMSGQAFAPIASQTHASTFLLTDHELKPSAALRKLVELGPESLPFLLDALDDETPTKLTMKHDSFMGVMYFANELWGNPVNALEQKALESRRSRRLNDREEHIMSYTVKVGDVCLVAIGQITGRGYHAVRYQPTACIVINSPTHDKELCSQVRAIWTSKDPAQKLLDSLLTDYATEGIYRVQAQAAMRLLYYFRNESAGLLATRLASLDVRRAGPGVGSQASRDEWERRAQREAHNGVRTHEFVEAVSWCREPAIRQAVLSIFKRSDDVDILLAALPGIDGAEQELVRTRLETLIDKTPAEEGGAYGDGYNLLFALSERVPKKAKAIFERYSRDAGSMRCYSVCLVLQATKPSWSDELLIPLLADKRDVDGYTHADAKDESGRHSGRHLPIRVCDAAAEALSHLHPEIKFDMIGRHQDLDRQIRVIQEQLGRKK